jgi:ParB family chromosome partitioning protein
MVNSLMKESNEKVALLEARLKQFEGVLPVRLIDPEKILASKWANRDTRHFSSEEFAQLKEEISAAEGNVQPIKVRPLPGDEERYEIVFGHRRHRACLELGKPVLAMVEEVSDVDLFKEMDRENRTRLDLSPWEQGMMYRRALDEKLFASQEQLAKELGVDAGNLSKALRLAGLDQRVVSAFSSPLDLQYRWAKPLMEAVKEDEEGVLARAAELSKEGAQRLAKEVFEILVGFKGTDKAVHTIVVDGIPKATLSRKGNDVTLKFEKGVLSKERVTELQEVLAEWLKN